MKFIEIFDDVGAISDGADCLCLVAVRTSAQGFHRRIIGDWSSLSRR
ncbi:hypothetical protein [Pandoraea pulmonicola]|nr:hypothetical protein [Pandoraea pulmonicola]